MIRTRGPLAAIVGVALLAGCATAPTPPPATPSAPAKPSVVDASARAIGVGSPESLVKAITTLGNSTEGYSDAGLELSYVAYKLIETLYPLYLKPDYTILPPATSAFPAMFRDIAAGRYPTVAQGSASFLTLIVPPLAVLYSRDRTVADLALESLRHAQSLNPGSVIPYYLIGLIDERRGDTDGAIVAYDQALALAPSCYPASIGKSRILMARKEFADAESVLSALTASLPPSAVVLRLKAQAQFALGKYADADAAITASLKLEPNSAEANIAAAQIFEAERAYGKGVAAVNAAEKLSKTTPQLLLLKARLFAGQGDPLRALDTLRQGTQQFPNDREIADAYGKALLEAGRTTEGSAYIVQNLKDNPDSVDSLKLLVDDAIKNRLWTKGAQYVEKLVRLDQSDETLLQAYTIYQRLGDAAHALTYAEKLYERHPDEADYVVPYARALAAAARVRDALDVIATGLQTLKDPNALSDLYYLRSTLDADRSARLADLHAALLENLENLSATLALSKLYADAGDAELAQRYLRQAQSLAPDDPAVKAALARQPGG